MTQPPNIQIAVLMGGDSAERGVSLNSGRRVSEALRALGCRVVEVDWRGGTLDLAVGTEVVFIALHGTGGEDGLVQGMLEKRGLSFTGSGSEASRLAFDKVAAKKIFREHGLETPRDMVLQKNQQNGDAPESFAYWPVVVKPSQQGSSIGIQIVEKREQMAAALRMAFEKDDTVLVEEFIAGREVTVGILGEQALPVIEIRPKQGWFDYHNKYTDGATEELVPAPIAPSLAQWVQREALKAHRILGCRDMSRADFRIDPDGRAYLLEVNTIPGMTATSLLPKAAAAAGIDFPRLCLALVEFALKRGGGKP